MHISDDACSLCFDNKADVTLQPCQHRSVQLFHLTMTLGSQVCRSHSYYVQMQGFRKARGGAGKHMSLLNTFYGRSLINTATCSLLPRAFREIHRIIIEASLWLFDDGTLTALLLYRRVNHIAIPKTYTFSGMHLSARMHVVFMLWLARIMFDHYRAVFVGVAGVSVWCAP